MRTLQGTNNNHTRAMSTAKIRIKNKTKDVNFTAGNRAIRILHDSTKNRAYLKKVYIYLITTTTTIL